MPKRESKRSPTGLMDRSKADVRYIRPSWHTVFVSIPDTDVRIRRYTPGEAPCPLDTFLDGSKSVWLGGHGNRDGLSNAERCGR